MFTLVFEEIFMYIGMYLHVWSILMAVVWLMVTIACPANIFYDVDNCWLGAVNSPRGYIFDKRSLSTATFVSVNSSGFLKLKIVMSIRFCIPSWVLLDQGICCCDCECSSADAIFHMLEIVPVKKIKIFWLITK